MAGEVSRNKWHIPTLTLQIPVTYVIWDPRVVIIMSVDSLAANNGRHNDDNKQRVLMHGHQGWNVRHGLCHIYMIYVYIWVVYSLCLFCCLFIIVTTQFVALYKSCKPKPKPSTYDPPPPHTHTHTHTHTNPHTHPHPRTTTPWQRSKDRYLDRSQSNKYAINMQIQTISVSK